MQKILIVEDDALNSALTQLLLEKNGYECDTAGNSASALLLFRNTRYDVVLMDILLPGTNGIVAMKAIKRLRPEIPVVAVTAFS
ncbi:MAG: response regulator, partial [bacterium]|nr:response regulator [bacterium]